MLASGEARCCTNWTSDCYTNSIGYNNNDPCHSFTSDPCGGADTGNCTSMAESASCQSCCIQANHVEGNQWLCPGNYSLAIVSNLPIKSNFQ